MCTAVDLMLLPADADLSYCQLVGDFAASTQLTSFGNIPVDGDPTTWLTNTGNEFACSFCLNNISSFGC